MQDSGYCERQDRMGREEDLWELAACSDGQSEDTQLRDGVEL